MPPLGGGDHCLRLSVMAGGANAFRRADVVPDLIVDRRDDVAHREVVVLDRAVARDFRRAVVAFGQLEPGGVAATDPGAGGAEAWGAGALQAARARPANTSRASIFIVSKAPGRRLSPFLAKRWADRAAWQATRPHAPGSVPDCRRGAMDGPDLRDRGQRDDQSEHDADG